MNVASFGTSSDRTVIIGAGMAGLAAAISLAARGREVLILEAQDYPGGKMRTLPSPLGGVDSGPTVFTMKYVFDELFGLAGKDFSSEISLNQANILARHAWNDRGLFDLHADRRASRDAIGAFFGLENAHGFDRFCKDTGEIFEYLKESFIAAQRPSPIGLGKRIGLANFRALWQLQPFVTLMSRLKTYFPDSRLQQLYGRYATYVGSSPYAAPATLMLIAHVEQEGVWMIDGGMHVLARKMAGLAQSLGSEIRYGHKAKRLVTGHGRIAGVLTGDDQIIPAGQVLYCGDISALTPDFFGAADTPSPAIVEPQKRSLSALTWSMEADSSAFALHRHNVFFSDNYRAEFESVFERGEVPNAPTVYICAQDRDDDARCHSGDRERLLLLINAPANGDTEIYSQGQVEECQSNMMNTLRKCGLKITARRSTITTPRQFNTLFPGSGGALYGRASHGWMASFARPGAKTKIPGLYLAGGSVHPGPGVPMATRSGMLAAEQIIRDRVLT